MQIDSGTNSVVKAMTLCLLRYPLELIYSILTGGFSVCTQKY